MAIDMFLKLGDIAGESQDAVHRGEIEVLAWSWGASSSGSLHAGGGGAGRASFQDLSISKWVDRSSEDLLRLVATGRNVPDAQLTLRTAGSDTKPLEFLVIRFSPVIVTSVAAAGSGGEDRLTENVTLNFAQFEYIYTPRRQDGGVDAPERFGWQIAENRPL